MVKPIRNKKNGQFAGSIGQGKTKPPLPNPVMAQPTLPSPNYPKIGQYEDGNWVITTEIVDKSTTPDFDRRARLLLGVEDQEAPVVSYVQNGEDWESSTIESWNEITIECSGRKLTLEGDLALPRLLRRLEFANEEPPRTTVMRLLQRVEPFLEGVATLHYDDGRERTGKITHLSAVAVYFEGMTSVTLDDVTHITVQ